MSELEKKAIEEYVRGMSLEEKQCLARCIPPDILVDCLKDYMTKIREALQNISGKLLEYSEEEKNINKILTTKNLLQTALM